ncbi:MAG: hypothetical protein ACOX20_04385 [Limnochordia bacterium]
MLRFIGRIRRKETALYDLVAAEGCEDVLMVGLLKGPWSACL